jgi:hypothetical protein
MSRAGRSARRGSTLLLLVAVAACSGTTTPGPTTGPRPTTRLAATPTVSARATLWVSPSRQTLAPQPTQKMATLKSGPEMTMAREGHAAVRLADGRVLILGGTVPFTGKCEMACMSPATASVEIYDPSAGEFSLNGSLAEPRSDAKASLLEDGRLLVSGGTGQFGEDLSSFEIYDPGRGTSAVVKLPSNVSYLPIDPAIVLLGDGKVLIAGGSYAVGTSSSATLVFDPVSGGFSNGPLMAQPRQGATATLLVDGRVLIAGGSDSNPDAELMDLLHASSRSIPSVSEVGASASLLADGRVLLTGGGAHENGANCVTPVVADAFDPKSETFVPVSPMSTPRTGSVAVTTQDGRVVLIGGLDSNCAAVDSVEAFDPGSGSFKVIATGVPKIADFSATLLDDGRILVAGGHGSDRQITNATWILEP